jgi:hypothetical protein
LFTNAGIVTSTGIFISVNITADFGRCDMCKSKIDLLWPWRGGTWKERAWGFVYAALLILIYATLHAVGWWLGAMP